MFLLFECPIIYERFYRLKKSEAGSVTCPLKAMPASGIIIRAANLTVGNFTNLLQTLLPQVGSNHRPHDVCALPTELYGTI